jgi:hypothetical protein
LVAVEVQLLAAVRLLVEGQLLEQMVMRVLGEELE